MLHTVFGYETESRKLMNKVRQNNYICTGSGSGWKCKVNEGENMYLKRECCVAFSILAIQQGKELGSTTWTWPDLWSLSSVLTADFEWSTSQSHWNWWKKCNRLGCCQGSGITLTVLIIWYQLCIWLTRKLVWFGSDWLIDQIQKTILFMSSNGIDIWKIEIATVCGKRREMFLNNSHFKIVSMFGFVRIHLIDLNCVLINWFEMSCTGWTLIHMYMSKHTLRK